MSRESNTKAHKGKTQRDRASGALARRSANQLARASWQEDSRKTGLQGFPWATCNGQEGKRWKRWLGLN